MFSIDRILRKSLPGTLLGLLVTLPAMADDIEIYRSTAENQGARPNVLFIMDTSGSMDTYVESYDATKSYAGSCDANTVYYNSGDDDLVKCDTANKFPKSLLACKAAITGLAGPRGSWPSGGTEKLAVFRKTPDDSTLKWRSIRSDRDNGYVECEADSGSHGKDDADTRKYINNGGSEANAWDIAGHNLWKDLDNEYRLFSGNYLNYKYSATGGQAEKTRLQIVTEVATDLAKTLKDVNLGIMRYNDTAEGGQVIAAVQSINDNRQTILDALKFNPLDGNNGTPLSETYYEAARYLTGRAPDFGDPYKKNQSPADSRYASPGDKLDAKAFTDASKSVYKSPIEYSCQKSYIVYLTDGAPTVDDSATEDIQTLIGAKQKCDKGVDPFHDNGWTEDSGICMDEIAKWLRTTDLNPDVPEPQNAFTYMIGFGDGVGSSQKYLDAIADAGGTGTAFTAFDYATLTKTLSDIFKDLQDDSNTFVTPSISVNAFNRTQTDNDLFFSLFKVNNTEHWPGNLKKYKLGMKDGKQAILAQGNPGPVAVDPATGFFAKNTQSFWSPTADGDEVEAGGALSQLKAPGDRKLLTAVSGNTLVNLNTTNVTDTVMNLGAGTTCGADCAASVGWIRGEKLDPKTGAVVTPSTAADKKFMGDMVHGRPATVTYGKIGTGDAARADSVVFAPTNDGLLHAISTYDGSELWAFMPKELLPRLNKLRLAATNTRADHSYGLDGDIRVLKLDVGQDGTVDKTTDRVWLFFGMRAGGNRYYALDVTDKSDPKLMWNIGPETLPGIGQTWSPPVVTRVNVKASGSSAGNTDAEKFVLVFGGGYDPGQDTLSGTPKAQKYSTDTVGNRVFMVEAKTGALLWWAGGPNTAVGTPSLTLTTADNPGKTMNNSIPARVTVIDTNGDQFADRMYVGDMGGRLWRFDIFNGKTATDLVTGGVWAQLGAGHLGDAATAADNRRFYSSPDVALIQLRGSEPYYNVAIGSGYRGHPLDQTTTERFYSLRDRAAYAQLTQDAYNKLTPIQNGQPDDITASPTNAVVDPAGVGWAYTFKNKGQKVLADSTTVSNIVLFPTFEPTIFDAATTSNCYPKTKNRVFALTAFGGKPALDFKEDRVKPTDPPTGKLDDDDVSTDLSQDGIVGDINVGVLRDKEPSETVCLAGMEVLKKCVNVGGTVRTFWDRDDAQ